MFIMDPFFKVLIIIIIIIEHCIILFLSSGSIFSIATNQIKYLGKGYSLSLHEFFFILVILFIKLPLAAAPLRLSYHAYCAPMSSRIHFNHTHFTLHTFTIVFYFAIHSQLLAPFQISLCLFYQGRKGLQYGKFLIMNTLQRSAVKPHHFPHGLEHSSCGIVTLILHPKSFLKRLRPSCSDRAVAWA